MMSAVKTRIVSLVPSITELVVHLGLEAALVGVTKFCIHPAHLRTTKTIIGGTKNLRLDSIRALNPTLILANKEENEREQITALANEFNVYTSEIANWNEAIDMIRRVGLLTKTSDKAHNLISQLTQAKNEYEAVRSSKNKHWEALYLIWRDPWMSVGDDTFIHDMLGLAGFANSCGHLTRYPMLTDVEIASLSPNIILLSSEPYPFKENHIAELQKLVPKAHILLVDGEMFSWYGSRMLHTFNYFERIRALLEE